MRSCCLVSLFLACVLSAQVPEGWIVASQTSSLVGLQVLPPRPGSAPLPITNLPAELVLTLNVSRGANTVAIHPDGRVFAGNLGIVGGSPIAVHALRLQGLAVVSTQRVQVGTSVSTNGAVSALAFLPDGRCLVAASNLQAGSPMTRLAIVDVDAGTVSPLPLTGAPLTTYNALAVDAAGTTAWFGTFVSTTSGELWRVPVPAGGQATLVASFGRGVAGLDVDNDGRIVVGLLNAGAQPSVGRVDPATGVFTTIPGTGANTPAVTVERATGELVLGAITNSTQEVRLLQGGVLTMLADLGSGTLTGVDVQDSPRRYGTGTPRANQYRWQVAPNPGGLPFLGNAAFTLTATATPAAPLASVVVFGFARAQNPLAGVTLLVDPAGLISVGIAAATTAVVPVGIPADPALAGLVVHGQALHLEAGGLAASDGVTFGVIAP